jgi:hypothetical protein
MLDHQRRITEYLIDELRERNIVFNEYLLETIVEVALYYFEYSDDTDETQLSNYIFDSLVNIGYAPKQWVLDTVSGMIIEYMIDNQVIDDKSEIHFTFEDDENE